jgi:hypothetical protein
VVPAIFCGIGCAGLAIALHFLGRKFKIEIPTIAFLAAAAWVAITLYYNRLWSISLRDFNVHYLAKVNLVASAAGVIAAVLGQVFYDYYFLVGLMVYSVINFFGLFIGRLMRKVDVAIYLSCAAAGTLVSSSALFFIR